MIRLVLLCWLHSSIIRPYSLINKYDKLIIIFQYCIHIYKNIYVSVWSEDSEPIILASMHFSGAIWRHIPHYSHSGIAAYSFGCLSSSNFYINVSQQNPLTWKLRTAIKRYSLLRRTCSFYVLVQHILHLNSRALR